MHIETLKVFCDVIDTQSFSTAASQNFITQSAVSQQIRALEQRFGQKLIDRARGRARATPAGEILYQAGTDIVTRYSEMEDRIQAIREVVGGNLRVATVHSVGLYELSEPLRRFLRAYPRVNVHLDYRRGRDIHDDVIRGNVDIGIVAYPARRASITVLPFREDRLVLICAPGHPFADKAEMPVQSLQGERFVGFEREIPTRKATDRILRSHGVTIHYVAEVDNVDTIKRLVEIGQGVAIVPEPAVQGEVRNATLHVVRIPDEQMLRPLGIVHRRGRELSPAAQKFIEYLRPPAPPPAKRSKKKRT